MKIKDYKHEIKISSNMELPILIETDKYYDKRGYYQTTYNKKEYAKLGIKNEWFQDAISFNGKHVFRGFHFQSNHPQAKLVSCISGSVLDFVVDVRKGSKSFGKIFGFSIRAIDNTQLYIPRGFAHGFVTLEESTIFSYKVDNDWYPSDEITLSYKDEELGFLDMLKKFGLNKDILITSAKDEDAKFSLEYIRLACTPKL